MKIRVYFSFVHVVLSVVLVSSLHAQENSRPVFRLEDELTYGIPTEKTEEVWSFLKKNFKAGYVSPEGMQFRTVESVEQFRDTYFDTWNGTLVQQWAGLRFRHRVGEHGKIKELIQLKVTPKSGEDPTLTTRNEIKFFPALSLGERGEFPKSALLTGFLKGGDRERFANSMQSLGVKGEDLRPLLEIQQERRRIYFRQGEKQFFTVTLDIFTGKKYWYVAKLAQVEFEIGENLFTAATEEDRARYVQTQRDLFERVATAFPLKKDQTPKVVQMYHLLRDRGVGAKIVFLVGEHVLLASLACIFLAVWYLLVAKKRNGVSKWRV